jgi:hypothetical protein
VQGAVRVATLAWTAAQWLLNAALTANPLGLFIIAIVAVVAAIVLAYQKSETFRTIVQAVAKAVTAAFQWVVDKVKELWKWITNGESVAEHARDIIVAAFNAYTKPIRVVIGLIKDLVAWIGKIDLGKVASAAGDFFGFGGPPAAMAAAAGYAPSSFGGRGGPGDGGAFMSRVGGSRAGVTINVTVNGALDADAVGKQLEGIFRDLSRRRGIPVTT